MRRWLLALVWIALIGCPPGPGVQWEGDDAGECSDGNDNDEDGQVDCDDPGCVLSDECSTDDDDATGDDDDATGDDDDATGDDDDTVDDDDTADDDDTVDDDDTTTSTSISGDVDCEYPVGNDFWLLDLTSGDTIDATVDTVSAADTFDPAIILYFGSDPWNLPAQNEGGGDDQLPCTFPPPQYQCPWFLHTVQNTGPHLLVVAVGDFNQCVAPTGGYDLTVMVNGAPTTLTLVGDSVEF